MPPRLSRYAALTLAACSTLHTASAQKDSPAERMRSARPSYYTPAANGLKSFSCNVTFDWKDFISKASGKDIADDNPMLQYLLSVRLSVTDDLRGSGQLEWATNGLPPDALVGPLDTLRDSMKQMINGFFQTWNQFMNGGMVPNPDKTVTFTTAGEGFVMHGKSENMTIDEKFDRNVLLTEGHVVNDAMDVVAYPVYIDTEDGRVISSIRSIYRAPLSAPPAEVLMAVKYAMVSSYRVPSAVDLTVKNVGTFPFHFTDCVVKTTDAAGAAKH